MLSLALLISGLIWGFQGQRDITRCISCHHGIEKMGDSHDLGCLQCHVLPGQQGEKLTDHKMIIRNPSDPKYWGIFCGNCHKREIEGIESSLHGTLAGIINQTRYLWGAQLSPYPPQYGLTKALAPIPNAHLVDDFLKNNCLNCHIYQQGNMKDNYRPSGCAACHVYYHRDGLYKGQDRAILGVHKKGYPQKHQFQRPISNETCLQCHTKNHVGSDYLGLFERDWPPMFNVEELFNDTHYPGYHKLLPSVHAEKGLRCVDCHKKPDVMGDGKIYGYALEFTYVRCEYCHLQEDNSYKAELRVKGLRPRSLTDKAIPHSIEAHKGLHCSSCHALWSFGDYGLSVMKDETIRNGDPQWKLGLRFRRWEWLPLGLDHEGRIRVLRPKYQYLLTHIDPLGNVLLDSIAPQRGDGSGKGWAFMPYTPHSIGTKGRPCESCHRNSMAAGMGLHHDLTMDTALSKASPPALGDMGLLPQKTISRLLSPGLYWGKIKLGYALEGR